VSMKISTRQVDGVTIMDCSGRITLGEGSVTLRDTVRELLAKGHGRSGDPCMLWGYLGAADRFDKALVTFAVDYADQTTRDFEAWQKAIREGKVEALKAVPKKTKKEEKKKRKKSK